MAAKDAQGLILDSCLRKKGNTDFRAIAGLKPKKSKTAKPSKDIPEARGEMEDAVSFSVDPEVEQDLFGDEVQG